MRCWLLLCVAIGVAACAPAETLIIITPTHAVAPTDTLEPTPSSPPPPTPTEMPAATDIPSTMVPDAVAANADWLPVTQTFDAIEMVLVPPGCFTMGTDDEGADGDETPAHEQCFDAPFWIDRTEVTNAQFGSIGNFAGPNTPRDTISLPQAQTFCASRAGRLPTEAEWEYAARGPDSLRFPWGTRFEEGVALYSGNAGGQMMPVGSFPQGASWVGAVDMAGSLWEWTSTIYAYQYPYVMDDGRENDDDDNNFRAIRGGAYSTDPFFLRTTSRKEKHPTLEYLAYVGFRCVLPFEDS